MANAIPPPSGDLEAWEIELIGDIVRGFLSTRRSTPDNDFDDLFQDSAAHWWRRRARYSAERAGPTTFLRRVVKAKLIDLERERKAAKRGGGTAPLSLNRAVSAEDDTELAEQIEDTGRAGWLGMDLGRAISRLTERQREIARALSEEPTKAAAARRVGISRETLYSQLAEIREVFADEGLEDYL